MPTKTWEQAWASKTRTARATGNKERNVLKQVSDHSNADDNTLPAVHLEQHPAAISAASQQQRHIRSNLQRDSLYMHHQAKHTHF